MGNTNFKTSIMKIIRQTKHRLITDEWFATSKQDVIKEIKKDGFNKLKKYGFYESSFANFKIVK